MSDKNFPLLDIDSDEELLSFSNSPQDQACIGHLRGDFGCGTEFWTTWWEHQAELKGQEFVDELGDLVNTLREDGPLQNLRTMERFCRERASSRMSPQAGSEYFGFRVDTAQHRYYLRFSPQRGNYNFYIYCYQTDKFERADIQPDKEVSMAEDTIKVLIVEPMKPCEVREISGLEDMQAIVGGHIQAVYPFRDEVALVCNEEAKIQGLPYNRPLTNDQGVPYDMICGTFFLAGVGAEDFVSLTEEQIQKYKSLYDNMAVLVVESSAPQAEIIPVSNMQDFAVACKVSVSFPREIHEDDTAKNAFISHVTGIFNRDETLAERTVGDLNFTFQGSCVNVQYTFARSDKDAASAESFSEQCVRQVQEQLEEYGCKIAEIECFAEELELDHMREPAKGRGDQEKKKKGIRHDR